MGTDIHPYTEVRRDGVWHMVTDKVFPTEPIMVKRYGPYTHQPFDIRDYTMFSLFADVRGDNVEPISKPRALPDDISAEAAKELGMDRRQSWNGGWWYEDSIYHSHSWLTLAELQAVDYDGIVVDSYRGEPEEPASLREALGPWYFEQLNDLAKLGDPDDVRIVFAFDS